MNRLMFGDCRHSMRLLKSEGVKVQMCVTSPPYFGLRDYGHAGQIGLEKTPAEYVAALVEVFDCVRDVLAEDGVLWLNLGDSYAAQRGGSHQPAETLAGGRSGKMEDGSIVNRDRHAGYNPTRNASAIGLKHKDLMGMPWRVAFALQDAGWYLRQDIIWHKPNPMPESVTDRCTKAHEYMFLMAKSERYYFDSSAMKEAATSEGGGGFSRDYASAQPGHGAMKLERPETGGMRNKRSVWTVPTVPYSGAHFATFPPALIEPCVMAGSRPGDVVLDPFFGSGTTGQVAQALGRSWIGCELNQDYEPLQRARTAQESMVFA